MGSKNLWQKPENFKDAGWFSTLHHMRWLLMIGLVYGSWIGKAQSTDADTVGVTKDSAVAKEPWLQMDAGLFVEGMPQRVPFAEGPDWASQLSVGVEVNRFVFGFYRSEFAGYYSRYLIFPNNFELTSVHGGLFAGRQVVQFRRWFGEARVYLGAGDKVWRQEESGEAFARDAFYVIRPEWIVTYRVLPFIHGFGSAGYQWVGNLEMPGLSPGDFTGITWGLGLRFGLYYYHEK